MIFAEDDVHPDKIGCICMGQGTLYCYQATQIVLFTYQREKTTVIVPSLCT